MSLVQAQGGGIGQGLMSGLQAILGFLPTLIGALIILLIGYVVAKVLQKLIQKGMHKTGVDSKMKETQVGGYVDRMGSKNSPSRLTGRIVFWVVFLFSLVSAIGALGIPALSGFMNQVLGYLPNVIAALAIFVIAGLVAGAVSSLATSTLGDTASGKIVSTVGPTLVMAIGVFMILTQLGIAPAIVQITYTALMGAIALGLALAFGLGGRDIAADMLSSGYRKAKEEQPTDTGTAGAPRTTSGTQGGVSEDQGWSTTPAGERSEPGHRTTT
ncbi:mechanosensitive ion channel [Parasphingorhabdus pacifica]